MKRLDYDETTTIDYTYDKVQRLLSANYDSGDRVYDFTYDLAGNRLEEDLSGTGVTAKLTEFEYTDANQIVRKFRRFWQQPDSGNNNLLSSLHQ